MTTTGKVVFGGLAILMCTAVFMFITKDTVDVTTLESDKATTTVQETEKTETINPSHSTSTQSSTSTTVVSTKRDSCTQAGGTWDEVTRECGGIDEGSCKALGGTFDECASPCRNNPDAQACIQMCVAICVIK